MHARPPQSFRDVTQLHYSHHKYRTRGVLYAGADAADSS